MPTNMSTGKRLAKRSILGTRIACWLEDGKYYPGVICNVKTSHFGRSLYTVRLEGERQSRDLRETDLVGSGFTPVSSVKLKADQKVYITHNQREIIGKVIYHRPQIDEVLISVTNPENGIQHEVKKRLEDIRLLESRKSARLADQDTDFAKLADCASDRMNRKTSSIIDVPMTNAARKRRNSPPEDDLTDECAAALVLMKLSCSPRSQTVPDGMCFDSLAGVSPPSDLWSLSGMKGEGRSTPSPPLSELSPSHSTYDVLDFDDIYEESGPRKRRISTRIMFKCTWDGCDQIALSCDSIEQHVRAKHLGRQLANSDCETDSDDDHEEEFYWTEVEVNVTTNVDPIETLNQNKHNPPMPVPTLSPPIKSLTFNNNSKIINHTPVVNNGPIAPSVFNKPYDVPPVTSYSFVSSPPTLSHMDMARPAHEDPDYGMRCSNSPSLPNSWPRVSAFLAPGKIKARATGGSKIGRGKRGGESRKCRKVYGMEQKDQWCTQCKWKKACSRFGE